MAKVKVQEPVVVLRAKYRQATLKHERLRRDYQNALESARQCFAVDYWDGVKTWLEEAQRTLEASANAREEADTYKKELDARKAVY